LDRADLSGGMAKRVAVARAVALDPVLLMYDEPTTGLDPEHAERLANLIRDGPGRKTAPHNARTTVIITPAGGLRARIQPRIVMLHQGRVFFDGRWDEFRASDSPPIRPYIELMPALHQCLQRCRPVRQADEKR